MLVIAAGYTTLSIYLFNRKLCDPQYFGNFDDGRLTEKIWRSRRSWIFALLNPSGLSWCTVVIHNQLQCLRIMVISTHSLIIKMFGKVHYIPQRINTEINGFINILWPSTKCQTYISVYKWHVLTFKRENPLPVMKELYSWHNLSELILIYTILIPYIVNRLF